MLSLKPARKGTEAVGYATACSQSVLLDSSARWPETYEDTYSTDTYLDTQMCMSFMWTGPLLAHSLIFYVYVC